MAHPTSLHIPPLVQSFIPDYDNGDPLFLPRRSWHVPASDWGIRPGHIPETWDDLAAKKGFHILARVRDRYHLILECVHCGGLSAQKIYTLRTAQPLCGACHLRKIEDTAAAAGFAFLGFHPEDRHSGIYRATCGHEIIRQFGFVERVARGEVSARCETCLVAREEDEASRTGWTRIGRDPDGNCNYRIYRHVCGHEQRIARANMAWRQCDCAGCGQSWCAKESAIYLMRITWKDREVIKLGFSANPEKRFRHQLGLPRAAQVEPIRVIRVVSGNLACRLEKATHGDLSRRFPEAVVPKSEYYAFLNVVSEIYRPALLPELLKTMNRIAQDADCGI